VRNHHESLVFPPAGIAALSECPPARVLLPVIQIDYRLRLLVRDSIKKGKCRPRDAFE
jgi:hypothetical protein